MFIKYQFLKENHIVEKVHINTLLDIIIAVILTILYKLPQMIDYSECFKDSKTMSFSFVDQKLLKKV